MTPAEKAKLFREIGLQRKFVLLPESFCRKSFRAFPQESQFLLRGNTNITQLVFCMSIHRKVEATAEECPLPNLSLSKLGISDLDGTPTKTMAFPVWPTQRKVLKLCIFFFHFSNRFSSVRKSFSNLRNQSVDTTNTKVKLIGLNLHNNSPL